MDGTNPPKVEVHDLVLPLVLPDLPLFNNDLLQFS
jgi:hypothetical protein